MENTESSAKLESLNREIALLSSQLKDLGAKKESKYKEKESCDIELNSLIKAAQELRDKKTKVDAEVKGLKTIRDVNNKSLKEYYGKLAERKVQQHADKKGKLKATPAQIKKQIEAMLFSIETEGISFEREKTYMDKIKHLKIELAELEKEEAKFAEIRQMRTEITGKKKDADEAHEKIQKLAAESSGLFAQLKEKSEQIAKAKKLRAGLQSDVKLIKTQLEEVDAKLVSVLAEWSEITKTAPPAELRPIQAPAAPVSEMEQLRAKKKLTKEDILAMQKAAMKRR